MNKIRLVAGAATITLAMAVSACGSSGNDSTGDSGSSAADTGTAASSTTASAAAPSGNLKTLPTGTDKLCGDKPIKIALVDGFGANSWRKTVRGELAAELAPCDNVEISYSDAGGDVQKYNSAINSYIAKGYDGLLTFDDFGEQGLAALRNATKAGVAVVPYISETGGTPGTDFVDFLSTDKTKVGQDQVDWLSKLLGGKGNLVFMGGIPGNSSSKGFFDPLAEAAPKAGLKFLVDQPIDTNWDPAQEQRVMAGLISKYPDINGIVSDYGVASVGGVRAYLNANKPHPPLATNASDNELGCEWAKLHKKWPDFQILSLDGSTRVVRWAARRALATINDVEINDPTKFQLFPFIDTTNGKAPACDKNLPPDADLSSALSPEELQKLFS